jgi:acyl-CoA synthetase (AMP-forming)/AMP-acid ligase II
MHTPERRQRCQLLARELLPCLADYVTHWARVRPGDVALIEHDTGQQVTWARFEKAVEAFAAKLLSLGLRRGDVIATSLPFLKEHVFLEYACFRIGVIVAPLDLRLKVDEIRQAFEQIQPKAWFFLGNTPRVDFRPIVAEVMRASMASATPCRHWVQFQADADGILDGAVHVKAFAKDIPLRYLLSRITGSVRRARKQVGTRDPALIIFTTGSTGSPKPALLCHENILLQNIGLAVGFDVAPHDRMLVNLPPSHVAGQTEQLMTIVYGGGVAVLLHIFDARKSLEAIRDHRATVCGQIPALFNMEWRLPDFADFDTSSLRFAIYGGQSVDKPFLEKLRAMAHLMGTGLGLTETAGFCTYTPPEWKVEEILGGLGFDSPLCPISIRAPIKADGTAGETLPAGVIGEICFEGPQVFLGYMHDPEATARAVSRDGVCYTGDLGSYDDGGLHFAGRSKFVIKTRGYQVYPGEVEAFITESFKDRVANTSCVGVAHPVFTEAIMAFVELKPGAALSREEIDARLRDIAAYKRPSHVVFLDEGSLPLTRVAKVDVIALQARAAEEVARLAASGAWG